MSCDRARRRCLFLPFYDTPTQEPNLDNSHTFVLSHTYRKGRCNTLRWIYLFEKWIRERQSIYMLLFGQVTETEKKSECKMWKKHSINKTWWKKYQSWLKKCFRYVIIFFHIHNASLELNIEQKKKLTCWPRTIGFSERYPRSLRWWRTRDCNCARWETLIRKRLINGLCGVSVKSKEWRIEHTQKSKRFFFNDWHGRMVIDGESELLSVLGDLKSSGGLLPSIWMDEGEKIVYQKIYL